MRLVVSAAAVLFVGSSLVAFSGFVSVSPITKSILSPLLFSPFAAAKLTPFAVTPEFTQIAAMVRVPAIRTFKRAPIPRPFRAANTLVP